MILPWRIIFTVKSFYFSPSFIFFLWPFSEAVQFIYPPLPGVQHCTPCHPCHHDEVTLSPQFELAGGTGSPQALQSALRTEFKTSVLVGTSSVLIPSPGKARLSLLAVLPMEFSAVSQFQQAAHGHVGLSFLLEC